MTPAQCVEVSREQGKWALLGEATVAGGLLNLACPGDLKILDCSQLEHVDSVGIAVLVDWQLTLQQQHKRFALSNPTVHLLKLVEMHGLHQVLACQSGGSDTE